MRSRFAHWIDVLVWSLIAIAFWYCLILGWTWLLVGD